MAGTLLASPPARRPLAAPHVDEAGARRSLREQIGRLEAQLGQAPTAVYPALPGAGPPPRLPGAAGARHAAASIRPAPALTGRARARPRHAGRPTVPDARGRG